MAKSFLNGAVTVSQGAFLPHWSLAGATYHVVFRLSDSLPVHVVEGYRQEREALRTRSTDDSADESAAVDRLRTLFSARIEAFLDVGHGACWLSVPEVASLVSDALRHFDGQRYSLWAWCIMPNHVHVVVSPAAYHSLTATLHSWKSFTAKAANKLLGRAGAFWQKESYDHIARDAADLERTIAYVQANPTKAGLERWPWVWP